ncbi:tetratricopeptide repeat protein [Salmonella enterica]|uniref:tetratricopeptide repeat protein n=1 Tax=Salmonella enterica TaxID=28901 RepID=UPI0038D3FCE8
MYNRAVVVDESGNEAEALAEYARLIARFGDSDHPAVQELVACAMYNRAVAVEASGNEAEALAEYARLIARFGDSDLPAVQEQVARAMYNRAVVVKASGNETEALAEYARLIARFGDSEQPAVQEPVARCHAEPGAGAGRLRRRGRRAGGVRPADCPLRRTATTRRCRCWLPGPCCNRAVTLNASGDKAEALAEYARLTTRFGDSEQPAAQELVARAMFFRAQALDASGRRSGSAGGVRPADCPFRGQ